MKINTTLQIAPVLLKILTYLLSILLLVTFLRANSQATPIQVLDITINYYSTPSWASENNGIGFSIFEAPGNNWPYNTNLSSATLASGGSGGNGIDPGINQFEVSLAVTSLNDLYITMSGGFFGGPDMPGDPGGSIFVAEPPDGHVSDGLAFGYGPPWISLTPLEIGAELSGDLYIINGYDSQAGTSHPWVVGTWEVSMAVPEPASMLLFGAGLAGFFGFRFRKKK
jgi:hypothetical protein